MEWNGMESSRIKRETMLPSVVDDDAAALYIGGLSDAYCARPISFGARESDARNSLLPHCSPSFHYFRKISGISAMRAATAIHRIPMRVLYSRFVCINKQ